MSNNNPGQRKSENRSCRAFLQSLKKFLRKMSLVVYSCSNILAKNVATSSASGLSLMCLPASVQVDHFWSV